MLRALVEISGEVAFMQRSTDGLVVDVTRNPGGSCYFLDAAARFMTKPFYAVGHQIRPTHDWISIFQATVEDATLFQAEPWVITTYQFYLNLLQSAIRNSGTLTGPIPLCTQFLSDWAPLLDQNPPAPVAYTKPMIVLVDEFSASAADIFPSIIQDNQRAPLVGARTNGAGGSVTAWDTGHYSETYAYTTETLLVRKNPVVAAGFPTAPYIENIGIRPEVPLEYMTRENLLTGGRPYVTRFTEILVEQIRKAQAPAAENP
jgi:C-terminal processing protease CtpA/Prc